MIKIEILEKDDTVLGYSNNQLVIQSKTGEVKVFMIELDENNLPRVNNEHLLITYKKGKGNMVSTKKDNIEIITF